MKRGIRRKIRPELWQFRPRNKEILEGNQYPTSMLNAMFWYIWCE